MAGPEMKKPRAANRAGLWEFLSERSHHTSLGALYVEGVCWFPGTRGCLRYPFPARAKRHLLALGRSIEKSARVYNNYFEVPSTSICPLRHPS